jgi:hypothetical protein
MANNLVKNHDRSACWVVRLFSLLKGGDWDAFTVYGFQIMSTSTRFPSHPNFSAKNDETRFLHVFYIVWNFRASIESSIGEMTRVRHGVTDGLRSVGRVMRVVVGRLVVPGDETGVYGGGMGSVVSGRWSGGRWILPLIPNPKSLLPT